VSVIATELWFIINIQPGAMKLTKKIYILDNIEAPVQHEMFPTHFCIQRDGCLLVRYTFSNALWLLNKPKNKAESKSNTTKWHRTAAVSGCCRSCTFTADPFLNIYVNTKDGISKYNQNGNCLSTFNAKTKVLGVYWDFAAASLVLVTQKGSYLAQFIDIYSQLSTHLELKEDNIMQIHSVATSGNFVVVFNPFKAVALDKKGKYLFTFGDGDVSGNNYDTPNFVRCTAVDGDGNLAVSFRNDTVNFYNKNGKFQFVFNVKAECMDIDSNGNVLVSNRDVIAITVLGWK